MFHELFGISSLSSWEKEWLTNLFWFEYKNPRQHYDNGANGRHALRKESKRKTNYN